MGVSTYCCLNPLPPTPTLDPASSPSLPTRSNLVPTRKVDGEISTRRNKNAMVIACAIVIGLEVGELVSTNVINGSYSMASELTMEFQLTNKNINKRRVTRWSDKRICPPWHMNSLETIVPENLPRPYTPRKWEGVTYSSPKFAPSVKSSVNSRTSCFAL